MGRSADMATFASALPAPQRTQVGPTEAEPASQAEELAAEEDEVEVSDEDITFFQKHGSFSRFLVEMDEGKLEGGAEKPADVAGAPAEETKKKRKRDEADPEAYYEKQARKTTDWRHKGEDLSAEAVDALPVKTPDGRLMFRRFAVDEPVARRGAADGKPEQAGEESPEADAEPGSEEIGDGAAGETAAAGGKAGKRTKQPGEPPAVRSRTLQEELEELEEEEEQEEEEGQRLSRLQQRMAELGTAILADPEGNLAHLKELQGMCEDGSSQVATLAMLSLASVYADILPGYRIRLPTEKEAAMPVSKEVRKLREYEEALLRVYQVHVQFLMRAVRSNALRLPALRCVAALLAALPHFNFRDSLLAAVVPRMDSPDDLLSQTCCKAVLEVMRHEGKHGGEATLEAVQLIADLVRQRHCLVRPEVLKVCLQLRFDENLTRGSGLAPVKGRKGSLGGSGPAEGNSQTLLSKRQRKAEKKRLNARLQKEVEADFREAEAVPDAAERSRLQAAVLAAVFETFFRVLKTALQPPSARLPEGSGAAGRGPRPLLGASLEGLAKFSHLISADFMGDLLEVLRQLARGGSAGEQEGGLTVAERLGCCVAAFRVVKSNLDALNVDLREFYAQLYGLLLEAPLEDGEEGAFVLAEALQVMLWEGRQADLQRCAAFVHHLAAAALHLDSARAVAALLVAGHLLQRHAKCRRLLENDAGGGGPVLRSGGQASLSEGAHLEMGDALARPLWLPSLLACHFHPAVSALATKVSAMGEDSAVLLQPGMTPGAAVASYSTASGGFRPPIPPPKSGKATRGPRSQTGTAFTAHFAALMRGEGLESSERDSGESEGGEDGLRGAGQQGNSSNGVGKWAPPAGGLGAGDRASAARWRAYFRDLRDHRQTDILQKELRRIGRVEALMKEWRERRKALQREKKRALSSRENQKGRRRQAR